MKRFFNWVLILLILFGLYTGLGYAGYHQQPNPVVHWIQGEQPDKSDQQEQNITDPHVLMEQSQYQRAEDIFQTRLKEASEKEKREIQYNLGRVNLEMGDSRDALTFFENVLKTSSDPEQKGLSHLQIARIKEGEEKRIHLQKAAFLDPRGDTGQQLLTYLKNHPPENSAMRLLLKSMEFIHETEPGRDERMTILTETEDLRNTVFQTGRLFYDAERYEIQSGDTLSVIGRRFHVGPGWINYTNNRPLPVTGNPGAQQLRQGDRLVIYPGPLVGEVSVSDTRMYLFYHDAILVNSFEVGIGNPAESPTPRGVFKVSEKDIEPDWVKPGTGEYLEYGDPDNILGTRWMGFAGAKGDGYGVHGTTEPDTIGDQVSGGCIRMENSHVEILYDMVPTLWNDLPDHRRPTFRVTD